MLPNRKKYLYRIAVISLYLLITPVISLRATNITVDDIAQGLMCQCNCSMLVSACEGSMSCGSAADMKKIISQKIKSGQSKDSIISYFVKIYGEKVLASPTKKGFNLTAWITPFAVLIGGIILIITVIRKWSKRGKASVENESREFQEHNVDERYIDTLNKELKEYEY